MGRSILVSLLVLLAVASGLLGYYEFFGRTSYTSEHLQDPAGWKLWAFTAKSPLLHRRSLEILVLAQDNWSSSCDGHAVTMRGHRMSGRDRVFLIDARGVVQECKAPVFEELWRYKDGPLKAKDEKGKLTRTWLRDSLRIWFPPERRDEALRAFLADDAASPQK
jgi:hypothetical protein